MKARLLLFSLFLTTTLLHAMEPATEVFFKAVKNGDVAVVLSLLEQNSTLVHQRDIDGNTPLHLAAKEGKTIIIALRPDHLCPERAKVNYHDYHRDNQRKHFSGPFSQRFEEISKKYQEVVHLLINHGAIVNQQNNAGKTPLHETAFIGSKNIGHLLLENGALIDQQDNDGWTPLHDASWRGYTSFVHFLLEQGASHITNNNGKTPIDVARSRGFDTVADMIQQCLQIRQQRLRAAKLTFCEVLHPKLGASSPANIFPQSVVQEILQHLRPADFAIINHQTT